MKTVNVWLNLKKCHREYPVANIFWADVFRLYYVYFFFLDNTLGNGFELFGNPSGEYLIKLCLHFCDFK